MLAGDEDREESLWSSGVLRVYIFLCRVGRVEIMMILTLGSWPGFTLTSQSPKRPRLMQGWGMRARKMGLQFLEIEAMQGLCRFYLISPLPRNNN